MFGFTVAGAKSPIVFITGSGCLSGVSRSGDSITFIYANADANTKFYCFDLVADNIVGSPYLKTYDDSGNITFNSLQPPLNVIASIKAPGPPSSFNGWHATTYEGGFNSVRRYSSASSFASIDSIVNIQLSTNSEYAASLQWARSAGVFHKEQEFLGIYIYSVSEGAFGRVGGISFMFGASGATTNQYNDKPGASPYFPASFRNIPTDRLPLALVIETTGLPFPYN